MNYNLMTPSIREKKILKINTHFNFESPHVGHDWRNSGESDV